MKLISVMGIAHLVIIVLGALVVTIGCIAAFDCHSYAIYRRKMKESSGKRVAPIFDMYKKHEDLKDYHGRNVEVSNIAWKAEFYFSSGMTLLIIPVFLWSLMDFGMRIGEPDPAPSFLYHNRDLIISIIHCISTFVASIFMLLAAVIPDLMKANHIEEDVQRLGSSKERWKLYLNELNGVGDTFDDISDSDGSPKISKDEIRKLMFKHYKSDLMRPHRDQSNFTLKVVSIVFCFLYTFALLVKAVLTVREMRKQRKVFPAPNADEDVKDIQVYVIHPPRELETESQEDLISISSNAPAPDDLNNADTGKTPKGWWW